jgi:hypothetical protein
MTAFQRAGFDAPPIQGYRNASLVSMSAPEPPGLTRPE